MRHRVLRLFAVTSLLAPAQCLQPLRNSPLLQNHHRWLPPLAQRSGLRQRGGLAPLDASGPVLVDCAGDAMMFFENLRTPAALVAGAALSTLYVQLGERERDYPVVQTAFSFLIALSVALEVSVVFMSTTMTTYMMSRPYKSSMAVDTATFLVREMEFSYVALRLKFFGGLLALMLGIALRSYVAFDHSEPLRRSMVAIHLASACKMVAFFNRTLGKFSSLPALFWRFLELLFFTENRALIWRHPMDILATVFGFVGAFLFVKAVVLGMKKNYDDLFQPGKHNKHDTEWEIPEG